MSFGSLQTKKMNDKGLKIHFERRFVLENLPEPLTRASEHLQFFDNYLTATRLWLRQVRVPQTKEWQRFFVQRYALEGSLTQIASAEIELNEYEYEVLSVFESNELRYNRYFYDFEGKTILIDVFLNRELWNLIIAAVQFETEAEMQNFAAPPFLGHEITQNENLTPDKLADLNLAEVQMNLNL
jgi:CYTH domain-containing protein